jgi:hypothetical protein
MASQAAMLIRCSAAGDKPVWMGLMFAGREASELVQSY